MQNSKNISHSLNILNDFSQLSKDIKNLRKINPGDKFPCFSCFDDAKEKLSCGECNSQGFVLGSHPMVQFAEDFIEKKFANLGYNCDKGFSNNSHNSNPSIESVSISNKMSSSYESRRKDMIPGKSTKTVVIIEEECKGLSESELMQKAEEPHYKQHFCNECIT